MAILCNYTLLYHFPVPGEDGIQTEVLSPTSIRVSFSQRVDSEYSILAERVMGDDQLLCPDIAATPLPNIIVESPYTLSGLEEFSTYLVTLTIQTVNVGLSSVSVQETTSAAGTYNYT